MNEKSNGLPAKVSIVMCTYNGEKYLREQLDSLINQTYPIHEILVQDDKSTDSTLLILQEYQQQYSNFRIEQNKQNLGYNANFSSAINKATGDYIAISDQDDIWMPNKIEKLVSHIGDKQMIFSKSTSFDENRPGWKESNYQTPPNTTLEEIAFRNNISGHAMLFHRELLNSIPFWDNRYYYDWWLAIIASYFDQIIYFDEALVLWRNHHQSVTQQFARRKESFLSKLFRLNDFLYRRKNYLNTLYNLLCQLEEQEIRHPEFLKIVKQTRNNNPFGILFSCIKCLKIRKIYYPNANTGTVKIMINSFMKPIRCLGF